MPDPIEVRKVAIESVTDASGLARLIDDGVIDADRVLAVIGKTHLEHVRANDDRRSGLTGDDRPAAPRRAAVASPTRSGRRRARRRHRSGDARRLAGRGVRPRPAARRRALPYGGGRAGRHGSQSSRGVAAGARIPGPWLLARRPAVPVADPADRSVRAALWADR